MSSPKQHIITSNVTGDDGVKPSSCEKSPTPNHLDQVTSNGPVTGAKTTTDSGGGATSGTPVKVASSAAGQTTVTSATVQVVPSSADSSPIHQSVALKNLLDHGLDVRLASRLEKLFTSTKLSIVDLDDRAVEALKEFGNIDGAISVLNEFEESNLEHVTNKSAFLCGLMKTHRQKEKANKTNKTDNPALVTSSSSKETPVTNENGTGQGGGHQPGPDDVKLKAILERTGYTLDVTSGQRKYGGPPPNWTEPSPGPGCEVFVGKIPKEIFEDELVPLFEECGQIWDLRLMIDPLNGYNRGYAFITYCTKDEALYAQQKFDGHEIRKLKQLKVNISVPNLRLFVGNIPKSKSRDEILNEFMKLTAGLNEVIVYSSPDDRKRNRGFCFLEYDSHKSASLAKRKLSTGRTKVWGCDILVDWADPQEEPDQDTMSKVKVLYVRNLVADVSEDEVKELFSKHGPVERVKKIKDYAFVHHENREQATAAMTALHGSELKGVKISVSLAKPPSDRKKKEEILRNRERRVSVMMQSRAGSIVTGMARGMGPPLPLPPMPLPPPMHAIHGGPSSRGGHQRGGHRGSQAGAPYGHRPSLQQQQAYGANWYNSWYNYNAFGPGAFWYGGGDPRSGPPQYPGWPQPPPPGGHGHGRPSVGHHGHPPSAPNPNARRSLWHAPDARGSRDWQPNQPGGHGGHAAADTSRGLPPSSAGNSVGGASSKQWRKTSSTGGGGGGERGGVGGPSGGQQTVVGGGASKQQSNAPGAASTKA